MQKLTVFCLGFMLLLLSIPAMAEEDDDSPFSVAVQARFLRPTGMPSSFVLVDPTADGDPDGVVEDVDFSYEFSPSVWLGWQRGEGGWYLGFWQFDEEEDAEAEHPSGGQLRATILHPDQGFDPYEGIADAVLGIDAVTVDLLYGRPLVKNDDFSMSWAAGLRHASLEYEMEAQYASETIGDATAFYESEADGIGLTGGIYGALELADSWSLSGGAFYSFLSGEVDSSMVSEANFVGGSDLVDVRQTVDKGLTILDLWMGVNWKATDMISVGLSYDMARWDNAVATQQFPDDIRDTPVLQTDDVHFDGFSASVRFRF